MAKGNHLHVLEIRDALGLWAGEQFSVSAKERHVAANGRVKHGFATVPENGIVREG